ncbi:MAG: aldo/keto reductase [Anaerolineae bacterium]|nr:aldo/keto reductase [Anaerolineae bacterium]
MQYRSVHRIANPISRIAIGTWFFGDRVAKNDALDCLACAVDSGINHIDTADVYARGEAQSIVGEFLKSQSRSSLFVSSKCYFPTGGAQHERGLSREHILASVNESLRRLNTDYLDILYCHRFDVETPLEETIQVLNELTDQGKIRYWGTSMWKPSNISAALEICGSNRPLFEQSLYNLLERQVVEPVLYNFLLREKIGLVAWSPLCGGILSGKYLNHIPANSRVTYMPQLLDQIERTRTIVDRLNVLAHQIGYEANHLSLAWLLNKPHLAGLVIGCSSKEQLVSNLHAVELPYTDSLDEKVSQIITPD